MFHCISALGNISCKPYWVSQQHYWLISKRCTLCGMKNKILSVNQTFTFPFSWNGTHCMHYTYIIHLRTWLKNIYLKKHFYVLLSVFHTILLWYNGKQVTDIWTHFCFIFLYCAHYALQWLISYCLFIGYGAFLKKFLKWRVYLASPAASHHYFYWHILQNLKPLQNWYFETNTNYQFL